MSRKKKFSKQNPKIPGSTERVKPRRLYWHLKVTPWPTPEKVLANFPERRELAWSEAIARDARRTEGFGRHGSRDAKPAAQWLQARRCVPAASARRVPRPDEPSCFFFGFSGSREDAFNLPRRATATAYPSRSPRSLPPSERATESLWSQHRHHAFLALSFALACTCGAFLWGHRATVFRLGASQLGPGPGEWLVEDPRVHGLSSAKLAMAAERHARELDQRDCLLVVKDGVIVHETYREGGDEDTLHYLDGVGRTAAALLIGAAEHQGVLDLDTPLSEYGIAAPPLRLSETEAPVANGVVDADALKAHPELRWGDEWSRVTARHVLGQATGLGEARVGEKFDAHVTAEILDVLSQVLRATTGVKPAEWAKEHFTGPLGVPDFFARDVGADGVVDGGVRVAGGQMATCRDAARFGQLLVNRGEWLAEDGTSRRLVSADFVKRVVNPSFPRAARQRGYQTWTHPGKTPSGAPRATPFFAEVREATDEHAAGEAILGAGKTTTAATPTRAPVWADYETSDAAPACGDDFAKKARGAFLGPAGPSFPLAFAVGELGKFLVVSPETSVVVVSMGNTWGSEREQCPSGLRELLDGAERARRSAEALVAARLGLAPGKTVGYDASVLMRQLWHAVGDAVTPVALLENGRKTAASSVSQIGAKRVAQTNVGASSEGLGAAVALGDDGAYARDKSSAIRAVAAAANASAHATSFRAVGEDDDYAPARSVEEARNAAPQDEKGALAAAQRQDALAAARRQQAERLAAATGAEEAARIRRRGVDAQGKLGADQDADPNGGRTGSCRCACPPAADGVGQCVNMRGVPEASCNDVALLGGARGFCPALGVTSTCAAPAPAAKTHGALGRSGVSSRRSKSKRGHGRRSLRESAESAEDVVDSFSDESVTVKISAARFGEALNPFFSSRLGLDLSDDRKITTITPESPAFECASSRACASGLGNEHTESFLCQPLTFVTCAWSDELCDQRSTRDATRRATKAPTTAARVEGSVDDDSEEHSQIALRLTEPSVPTYLGLKAANAAGTAAPPRVRLGVVPTGRAAMAAFAAAATAMLAGGVRLARSAARGHAGLAGKRASSRAEAGETTGLLGEAKKAKDAAEAAPAEKKPPAPPATPAPAEARASPKSTPPRASASKPPLPPKERTPPRRASADGGVDRDEKEKPAAAARSESDAAGFAAVEPGEGAESVDGNSDDEIDAWLAE